MDPESLREQFPVLRRVAYLNAGTCGPVPAQAVEATVDTLRQGVEEGRTTAYFQRRQEQAAAQRAAYAERLGCAPGDVALTTSTTDGIAAAFAGLALGPGDEIVTSDSEHPAGQRPAPGGARPARRRRPGRRAGRRGRRGGPAHPPGRVLARQLGHRGDRTRRPR